MSLIFVSHRESDQPIADLLVEYLLSALPIADDALRCTSVAGHQLPFGEHITARIGEDLRQATALVAILTKESLASTWVLFELGASWALGKLVIPIIGPGLSFSDLPGPLSEYPGIRIESPDASVRLRAAVTQISRQLGVPEKNGSKIESRLLKFLTAFRVYRENREIDVRQVLPTSRDSLPTSRASEIHDLIDELQNTSTDPHDSNYIAPALLRAKRIGKSLGASDSYFRALAARGASRFSIMRQRLRTCCDHLTQRPESLARIPTVG